MWSNPHLLRSFGWFNVPLDFFEFFSTEFAACSKPSSRDNHPKRLFQRRSNVTRVRVEPRSFDQGRRKNDAFTLSTTLPRLYYLPPSDIQVWTEGSVPSLFGPGGAGMYVTCSKCNTFNSLSFSTGPIASSFTAETFTLKQGLDWCTSHLMTCKFQSVLFLTASQSALSILSSTPYLLSEYLWNVWSLASSLSNNTTSSFQPRSRRFSWYWKSRFTCQSWCLSAHLYDHMPSPTSRCQSPLFPIPQLKTSHLSLPYELPSPRSLFAGTAPFSPHSLWAFSSSLPWPQSSFILISSQDQSEGEFCL